MPDVGLDSKPVGASKLEKEIFSQNLEKLHSGIIRKHKVCGLEYKGCPFYSKPSLIHFKVSMGFPWGWGIGQGLGVVFLFLFLNKQL